ncbi:MAG: hypothetical protein IPN09_05850 [Bacteroidetes bacterium]|nr:hypothetical protein [Bacteroidota bacterium]
MENRRNFIKKTMISGAGTMLVPSFLKSMEQRVDLQSIESDKKLIVIQLSGGNDGLNTVIPFKNDFYYKNRPNIAIKSDEVLKLTDEIGLNPFLLPFQKLIDKGDLCIINESVIPIPTILILDQWIFGKVVRARMNTGIQVGWVDIWIIFVHQMIFPQVPKEMPDWQWNWMKCLVWR